MAAILFSVVIPVLNEEEAIPVLLESIFKQTYRPLEVVVVDGGSTDRSVELIGEFVANHTEEDFRVTLVEEQGSGPAFARNLGIEKAHGANILLVDADYVLSESDVISQLASALESNPTAHARINAQADGWLAGNLMIDVPLDLGRGEWPGTLRWGISGFAFRTEVLRELRFDSSLGWGEDRDLFYRMAKAGVPDPALINASAVKRYLETLGDLRRQKQWYGRTAILWLGKYHRIKDLFWVLSPAVPFALLVGELIGYPFDIVLGFLSTVLFLMILVILFIRSPAWSVGRMVYLVVIRLTYSSFFYSLGLMQAIVQLLIRGQIDPSRDS